ncbi:CsiV family protein [endosymbiont of Lamellibrachia barhami]|uniref:CsiV family protein n=1 Tax=endosymbiont of Lamellibrachia barhami TaxID=205975 RepID=UPI0015AFCAE4|nr:CsiV family protein [endosymbiont of Lamellibrachia barhami]
MSRKVQNRHKFLLPVALILSLAGTIATAEEQPEEEIPPWYQFEVLIFERISPGAGSTEFWPEDPGTPSRLNAIPLTEARTQEIGLQALIETAAPPAPEPFRPLAESEWQLSEQHQHLSRSRNYKPLLHVAWRQQVIEPDQSQQLLLELPRPSNSQSAIDEPLRLEGTIRVGVKRYLHLATDLLLRQWETEEGIKGDSLEFRPAFRAFRMQSQRRMRSGEIHYLDHPIIGVLFLASRYELPTEPEPVEDGTPVDREVESQSKQEPASTSS